MTKMQKCKHKKINVIIKNANYTKIQSGPEKNVRNLMHHHFVTVRRKIMRFAPKCLVKIIAYHLMQNLYLWLNII